MYSLFISHLVEDQLQSVVEMSRSRFLEYTSETISNQLENLSDEAIGCLKSWPCVLMQEGRGQQVAYIAQITDIQIDARELKVFVTPFSGNNALVNDALWRLRVELDIAEFEFSRNHWAVKDRDLFQILGNEGFSFDGIHVARFENRPLPAPSRQELFSARNVISGWSHTQIDDLLLEAGVTGLEASRAIGSRRDRANAIIEYVLSNPAATTAENSMLSAFIVRRTSASGRESKDSLSASSGDKRTDTPTFAIQKGAPDVRVPNRVFVVHGQNESARTAVVLL